MSRPDVIDSRAHETNMNSRGSREIDDLIDEVRQLSEQNDVAKARLYQELGRLQTKLDGMRARMSPEEGDYFDDRLDHVESLLSELAGGDLSSHDFEGDPKVRTTEAIDAQSSLIALVDRFGVRGLKLVQAQNDHGRSVIVYGLTHNGRYLGEFETGQLFNDYTESQVSANIMQLLAESGVSFTFNSTPETSEKPSRNDVIDPAFPLPVKIEEDGIRLLASLEVSIGANGELRNVHVDSIGRVQVELSNTKRVVVEVLYAEELLYKITLINNDGSKSPLIIRGRNGSIAEE